MIRSAVLICLAASLANAASIYVTTASTNGRLLMFDSSTPGTIVTDVAISGLQTGEIIMGIDFRPANGLLYAVGNSSRLYTLNTITGAATLVGVLGTAITGTDLGADFNPVVDRLRVVTDSGQNLRVNPDTAAVLVDTSVNPGTPRVVGSAYTNSFAGSASTTLYAIDSAADQLYIQNPPNNGVLNAVGALGLNVIDNVGFDIAWPGNTAYASFVQSGQNFSRLYTVDLTTGAATLVGTIGGGNLVINALAIENVLVPEPSTLVLVGLSLAVLGARRRARR